MKVNFNLAGPERKALVKKIEEYTGDKPKYLGTPTYSYQIGIFNVGRYGELSWEGYADETAKKLVEWLRIVGFTAEEELLEKTADEAEKAVEATTTEVVHETEEDTEEVSDTEAPAESDTPVNIVTIDDKNTSDDVLDTEKADDDSVIVGEKQAGENTDILNEGPAEESKAEQNEASEIQPEQAGVEKDSTDVNHLMISFPDSLTDTQFEILTKIVESKATLLKHAFKADNVAIEREDGKLNFPWFIASDGDHTNAYAVFLQKLISFSEEAKRVTAQDHPVENEKYAFRTWLLRLGLIGSEYKDCRKILLENLTGSSAFRDGKRKTATVNNEEQEVSA